MFYDLKMSDAEKAKEKIHKVGFAFLLTYAIAAHISTALASAAMVGGVLSLLVLAWICKGEIALEEHQKKLLKVFSIFILLLLSTCPFSYKPQTSLVAVVGMSLRFAPMVMAIIFLRTSKQLQWVFWGLFFSLAIADVAAVKQLLDHQQTIGLVHNRIYFANQLLPMLIIAGPVIIHKEYSNGVRFIVSVIAIISGGILLFSQVRGIWVASALVLGVYCLLTYKRSKKPFVVLAVVILFSIGAFSINQGLSERLTSIGDVNQTANIERIYMWQSAWKMFSEEPIVGLGLGQFQHFYSTDSPYLMPLSKEPNYAHPHNVLMTFLAETGILGTVGFVGFYVFILKSLYRRYRLKNSLLTLAAFLTVVGFLIAGMTDNVFAMVTVMRFMSLLIGIGFCSIDKM